MAPLPSFAAVIVAAGKGLRAGRALPKQFANWRGKPLVRHSAETFARLGAHPIVIAIPSGGDGIARQAVSGIVGILFV
jgi:2-C-methyl-D-erythritol 4-phosphate cytidylyltransferase/2-C-methyl-D-erythritol 2,4-cyclodiphosphate synthase